MNSSRTSGSEQRRAPHLQKGSACVNCRRRKMRCDGVHPICGQCESAGNPDDCEYVVGQARSRIQILEENISRLENRIQELQKPKNSFNLQQPYSGDSSSQNSLGRSSHFPDISRLTPEPPSEVIERLIGYFLPYASEFGFFLDVSYFRTSALLPPPAGHPSRPSPALLAAVYLWGVNLSRDPSLLSDEESYLTGALNQATVALSGNHPHKVIHALQAEVLLAYYFFSNGRFYEGKYHVSAAVSIAVSAGLNKIRSAHPSRSPPSIPPPNDPAEEGEHIHAFWAVFILDRCWAAALDSSPNLVFPTDSSEAQIDTPWPLQMRDYQQGHFPPNVRTSQTLRKFLNATSTSDVGLSSKAIFAKASFLWERVNDLVRSWNPGMSQRQFTAFSSAFGAIDSIIDGLKASLIPFDQILSTERSEKVRTLLIAYSVLHACTIRLHNIFAQGSDSSKRKRMSCAQAIIDIVSAARGKNLCHLNPIISTVWVDASQVLINEILSLRSTRISQHMANPTDAEMAILRGFQRGLASISEFATSCTLTDYQVRKIQEAYSEL